MQSKTGFFASILDSELGQIFGAERQFVNDTDLAYLSIAEFVLDKFQQFQAINRLQYRLFQLKNSSTLIEEATIDIPAVGKRVTSQTVTDIPHEEYSGMLNHQSPFDTVFMWRGGLYSSDAIAGNEKVIADPSFVISVRFSNREFIRGLKAFTFGSEGHAILFSSQGQNGIPEWSVDDGADASVGAKLLQTVFVSSSTGGQSAAKAVTSAHRSYLVSAYGIPSASLGLLFYVPERSVMRSVEQTRRWYLLQLAIALPLVLLFSYWIHRLIQEPLAALVRAFRQVESGKLDPIVPSRANNEFGYLYRRFNEMVSRLDGLTAEVAEEKYLRKLADMQQLQSQIAPHFLYNCFFILYRMSQRGENEDSARFSEMLGSYFELISHNDSELISLAKEWKHGELYVQIQSVRFRDRICVEFPELPSKLRPSGVPPLIIQPLIENAYEHGLERSSIKGKIRVGLEIRAKTLCITIDDSGDSIDDCRIAEIQGRLSGTAGGDLTRGMMNVHRRLLYRFGEPFGLRAERSTLGGLRVTIALPYPLESVADNEDHGR